MNNKHMMWEAIQSIQGKTIIFIFLQTIVYSIKPLKVLFDKLVHNGSI